MSNNESNISTRLTGLNALICDMLRENSKLLTMSKNDLVNYTQEAGIALHNIPLIIEQNADIHADIFKQINDLDPSAKDGNWGEWATRLAASFGQTI